MIRLFREYFRSDQKKLTGFSVRGLTAFKGGLSAENYIFITGASRITVTRDLNSLIDKRPASVYPIFSIRVLILCSVDDLFVFD